MPKKYVVDLTENERHELEKLITTGKHSASRINHARILLKADINQPDGGWPDSEISAALDISIRTIERVRQRFVEESLEASLKRRSGGNSKRRRLDGDQEAHLVALVCGDPPEGRARWTLRLLADQMVELKYVESICHETVRQTLKKTNYSLGGRNAG